MRWRTRAVADAGPRVIVRRAFTLVELMVVVAVIALLAMVLLPFLRQAFEVAWKTRCLNNLSHIAQALHVGHERKMVLPTAEVWVAAAKANGSEQMLRCDKDTRQFTGDCLAGSFEDLYILQYHTGSTTSHDCSYLVNILDRGKPIPDPQVWAWYPAGGIKQAPQGGWPVEYLPNWDQMQARNQAFIGVDNDSGLLITFGDVTVFETWEPPQKGHSRHWLMQGAGTPVAPLAGGACPADADDKMLLHMWGWDMLKHDPNSPLRFGGNSPDASYGMNAMVRSDDFGPRQFLVMDANETIIRVGTSNYEDAEVFSPPPQGVIRARHMGKVNVVTCDGAVTSWSLPELKKQYDMPGHGRWNAR